MRNTINLFKEMKAAGEPIPMVTAYDYTTAKILEEAEIPLILGGDSLGQVVLGYETTLSVTMEDILHHSKAVIRGTQKIHVVADMPFMSYQATTVEALRNAARLMKEGGVQSVKMEGGIEIASKVETLVNTGIPVMGHIGLTPQSVNQIGGYRIQGRTLESARKILQDAASLVEAGVYALVLEAIPSEISKTITKRFTIPTIGIGAGSFCDGQVQVFHDLVGLFKDFVPRHAKNYGNLYDSVLLSTQNFAKEVQERNFPTDQQTYYLSDKELATMKGKIDLC